MNTFTSGPEIRHLRILFGPLFGADLMLSSPEVFFCVGDSQIDDNSANQGDAEHSLHHAVSTLYIPHRDGSSNFRLRFPSGTDIQSGEANPDSSPDSNPDFSGDFEVDFLSAATGETRSERFNTICRFGDIAFAVKRETDAWSEEVSAYTQTADFQDAAPNPQLDEAVSVQSGDGKIGFAVKVAVVLILGAALMGLTYWQVQQYIRAQKVASVAGLLARAPARNNVLPGHDGKIHVLSASEDGLEWDKQVLLKAAPADKIEVASLASERRRLEHELDTEGFDFVTVRMEQPDRPVLVLSGPVQAKTRDKAARALQQAVSFIVTVGVTTPISASKAGNPLQSGRSWAPSCRSGTRWSKSPTSCARQRTLATVVSDAPSSAISN
jgi:type III secretion system PrgH/EprH family protein